MSVVLSEVEKVLDAYTITDVLELNDLTEAEALEILIDEGHIELPTPRPL